MGKTKKINFWEILMLFIVFYVFFKQLNVYFPTSFLMLFLLLGCVVVSMRTNYFVLKDRSYFWLFAYFIVLFLNYITGDNYFDSVGDVIQEVSILFFTSGLFIYAVTGQKIKFAKYLVFVSLGIVIYYGISSYLLEIVRPGLIRNAVALINLGELDMVTYYYKKGLATYQLPHALPVLIPAIVMQLRNKKRNTQIQSVFLIASLIAIFLLVYISYAATALFLTVLIFILSLLVKKGTIRDNLFRLIIVAVIFGPVLLNLDVILRPLGGVFSDFSESLYSNKLSDIQTFADSGSATGDLTARENKYMITFNEIVNSPLWGTNKRTGNHSAIFDRLAALGLIGWIPYLLFLYAQIHYASRWMTNDSRIYYYVGIFAAFFMLITKNMSNLETWFMAFTILPLMTWLPSQNESQNT